MMIPQERLLQITERFEYLEAAMAAGSGDISELAKEYAGLKPVVDQISAWQQLVDDMAEAKGMLDDPEMRELAEEELPRLKAALPDAERALQLALLPKDAADARPAMLEIRPGTGGDEAALFAGDLLRMERMGVNCAGRNLRFGRHTGRYRRRSLGRGQCGPGAERLSGAGPGPRQTLRGPGRALNGAALAVPPGQAARVRRGE